MKAEPMSNIPAGPAQSELDRLRRSLSGLDPTLAPHLAEPERSLALGVTEVDGALGGGLPRGALHEFAPDHAVHLGAAFGFAALLAGKAAKDRGETLWIATDFGGVEGGAPYAPGLGPYGVDPARLLVLRVSRPADVLWAMEEGLRCRALSSVIAELTGRGEEADLTATRRLTLAVRERAGFGFLIRHNASPVPSAAATRWRIAAAPSMPDRFGGLGPAAFTLALVKNRRGPAGRWRVEWNCHDHVFSTPVSLGLAEAAFDRPDRAPSRRAG